MYSDPDEASYKELIGHIDRRDYEGAYKIFERSPGLLDYMTMPQMTKFYAGIKEVDNAKAAELRTAITKKIDEFYTVLDVIDGSAGHRRTYKRLLAESQARCWRAVKKKLGLIQRNDGSNPTK